MAATKYCGSALGTQSVAAMTRKVGRAGGMVSFLNAFIYYLRENQDKSQRYSSSLFQSLLLTHLQQADPNTQSSMSSNTELPETMEALVLTSIPTPPTIQIVPTPKVIPGSAVVRILYANVISYMRDMYNGSRKYPFPMPLITGTSAIGRIAALPEDATRLKVGDLVFVDCLLKSRDEPQDRFLGAIHEGYTAGSKKLMAGVHRDGTYAEVSRNASSCRC